MLTSKLWKEPNNFIDLWIVDKFNVLPTDIKFMSLYEEQKVALFECLSMFPDISRIKKIVKVEEKINELKLKSVDEFGNPGMIKRMEEMYKSQGLENNEIREKIRDHLNRIRITELKNLEKIKDEY